MLLFHVALASSFDTSGVAYLTCVQKAAVRLERSQEEAPVVADAALEKCSLQRIKAASDLVAESGGGSKSFRVLSETLEQKARRAAISRIVEIRAQRAEAER